jgi:putative Mg2+ transporter-C (MgtC) family protein
MRVAAGSGLLVLLSYSTFWETGPLARRDMVPIEWQELLLRLGVAALLGAIVGLDRELRHKPTGLRTVTLVSIGAALFTLLALQMASVTAAAGYDATGDIGRILISGIGILGAGVFLHRGGTVRLATTGASVWLAGAIGVAAGLGLYILAVAATALAILVLVGFGSIERRFLEPHESSAPPGDDA